MFDFRLSGTDSMAIHLLIPPTVSQNYSLRLFRSGAFESPWEQLPVYSIYLIGLLIAAGLFAHIGTLFWSKLSEDTI